MCSVCHPMLQVTHRKLTHKKIEDKIDKWKKILWVMRADVWPGYRVVEEAQKNNIWETDDFWLNEWHFAGQEDAQKWEDGERKWFGSSQEVGRKPETVVSADVIWRVLSPSKRHLLWESCLLRVCFWLLCTLTFSVSCLSASQSVYALQTNGRSRLLGTFCWDPAHVTRGSG